MKKKVPLVNNVRNRTFVLMIKNNDIFKLNDCNKIIIK